MLTSPWRHPGLTPRRSAGLIGYERVLARAGLSPVAGIDEAGRGACAGPLVVAAVVLNPARLGGLTELADSKALSPATREVAYQQVMLAAAAWHAVVIPSADIDRLGLHVCNLAGMRRALAGLSGRPGYVLTDGFPVRGLAVPALAMWQGDEVAACVAAASVVAKVTRDKIMTAMEERYPAYGFAAHKGYSTRAHMTALAAHGPCPEHRRSFANVIAAMAGRVIVPEVADGLDDAEAGNGLSALADSPVLDADRSDAADRGDVTDRGDVADNSEYALSASRAGTVTWSGCAAEEPADAGAEWPYG
jgi:ribonuclease HII